MSRQANSLKLFWVRTGSNVETQVGKHWICSCECSCLITSSVEFPSCLFEASLRCMSGQNLVYNRAGLWSLDVHTPRGHTEPTWLMMSFCIILPSSSSPPSLPLYVLATVWILWFPASSVAVKGSCPHLCPPYSRASAPERPRLLLGVFKETKVVIRHQPRVQWNNTNNTNHQITD